MTRESGTSGASSSAFAGSQTRAVPFRVNPLVSEPVANVNALPLTSSAQGPNAGWGDSAMVDDSDWFHDAANEIAGWSTPVSRDPNAAAQRTYGSDNGFPRLPDVTGARTPLGPPPSHPSYPHPPSYRAPPRLNQDQPTRGRGFAAYRALPQGGGRFNELSSLNRDLHPQDPYPQNRWPSPRPASNRRSRSPPPRRPLTPPRARTPPPRRRSVSRPRSRSRSRSRSPYRTASRSTRSRVKTCSPSPLRYNSCSPVQPRLDLCGSPRPRPRSPKPRSLSVLGPCTLGTGKGAGR